MKYLLDTSLLIELAIDKAVVDNVRFARAIADHERFIHLATFGEIVRKYFDRRDLLASIFSLFRELDVHVVSETPALDVALTQIIAPALRGTMSADQFSAFVESSSRRTTEYEMQLYGLLMRSALALISCELSETAPFRTPAVKSLYEQYMFFIFQNSQGYILGEFKPLFANFANFDHEALKIATGRQLQAYCSICLSVYSLAKHDLPFDLLGSDKIPPEEQLNRKYQKNIAKGIFALQKSNLSKCALQLKESLKLKQSDSSVYRVILGEKFLMEKRKLERSDIIDSALLTLPSEYCLLSLDYRLNRILESIRPEVHAAASRFKNEWGLATAHNSR